MASVLRNKADPPGLLLMIMTVSAANHHQMVSGMPSGMFAPGKFNG